MTDKPTPTTDLLKRCAEIHEWRSTGVLSGEALRDYAKRKWPDLHDTLQMAEHETVTEALALLATQPTQEQAGAVPLTDEQVKALMQAHRTAMLMTCKARVPECGEFAAIAQDLDWLCESLGIKGG